MLGGDSVSAEIASYLLYASPSPWSQASGSRLSVVRIGFWFLHLQKLHDCDMEMRRAHRRTSVVEEGHMTKHLIQRGAYEILAPD